MPRKTPDFWKNDTLLSRLLIPVSWLYCLAGRLLQHVSSPYKSSLPVLCVGGAIVGGSGKTPVVQAIYKLVVDRKLYHNPVILLRGYGGHMKGPTFVEAGYHDYKDVGDEALLHARHAKVIISRNRADGARLAELSNADIIIMDDGLQNNTLQKTWSFLAFDAVQGVGNGRTLPAGPMRESLEDAVGKCRAVICTNGECQRSFTKPKVMTSLETVNGPSKDRPYFAFAGLGRPEKFKETLISQGYDVAGFRAFGDHHPYSDTDMEMLLKTANGLPLITTEKDMLRLPKQYRGNVHVLKIRATFKNPDAFLNLWVNP